MYTVQFVHHSHLQAGLGQDDCGGMLFSGFSPGALAEYPDSCMHSAASPGVDSAGKGLLVVVEGFSGGEQLMKCVFVLGGHRL